MNKTYSMNKKYIYFFFLILLIFGGYRLNKYVIRQKKESRAISEKFLVPCTEITQEPMPEEFDEILNQPFFFLAKGKQSYAFVSEDKKYVLKFFQSKRLSADRYLSHLPDWLLVKKLRERKVKQKKLRKERLIESAIIASNQAAEETGIIYTHLIETPKRDSTVPVLERKGKLMNLSVEKYQFVIQKFAEQVKPALISLMYHGNEDEANEKIEAIFTLFRNSIKHGVYDRDPGLIRNNNIGLVGNKAIYVDTGKLTPISKGQTGKVVLYDIKCVKPLHKWLKKYYPSLAVRFEESEKAFLEEARKK